MPKLKKDVLTFSKKMQYKEVDIDELCLLGSQIWMSLNGIHTEPYYIYISQILDYAIKMTPDEWQPQKPNKTFYRVEDIISLFSIPENSIIIKNYFKRV